ncbi:molybdopterin-dependent oxidoreductase [Nocardia sp. 004]|uniref:molybdopterin-dependent oxidoreductase n=1 Tax=Nocardia sp. 004 TaxID=3385978 RepID=UPI00399F86AA
MAELRMRVVAGIVSAGVALGLAELLAVFSGAGSAPLDALGAAVVEHTPEGPREWAIDTFGTSDKAVLYLLMGMVAVFIAGLLGAVERTGRATGSWLFAAFGTIAAGAALAGTGVIGLLPTVLGIAAGIATLRMLTYRIDEVAAAQTEIVQATATTGARTTAASTDSERTGHGRQRRQIVRGLLIAGGLAVAAGVGGRLLGMWRRDVSGERAALRLPEPTAPAAPLTPGVELRVPGLTPYTTANDEFYRIDTALIVPNVSTDDWSLRIHGMVDREILLSWADLADLPATEHLITLACVSNPIGGDLIGNARWLGYRLDRLLAEAGPHPEADMVLSHSVDGWTAGTPLAVLTDGRPALLAIGMNGEPLPVRHGYPARMVVPGLYGYVSATKWVTELEVTRFDRAEAYWTRRGWSARGPIKTGIRIDTPRGRARSGRIPIAGVAWAQHRGIRAVEVQIDDGPWQPARLADEYSIDTWRQWIFDWDAPAGSHIIRARATDGTGETQTAERRGAVPDGATGYPAIMVRID